MNTNTMQRIDRAVGPFLGSLLLLLRRVFSRSQKPLEGARPLRKILIIKFMGMGTLLLASPALRRLKEVYPSAEITVLTLPQNKPLAEMLPAVDRVLLIEVHTPWKLLRNLWSVFPALVREKFDAVVDLEFFANFSALFAAGLTVFDPGIVTAGYDFPGHWRNRVFEKRAEFYHQKHISAIMLDLVGTLFPPETEPREISFDEERRIFLDRARAETGGGSAKAALPLITLNINSGDMCQNRKWPREHFQSIVTELQHRKNAEIVLIGGSQDAAYVNSFLEMLPSRERVTNLCGKTPFYQLLGVLAGTRLFITNDSGPLHIATVMGIPTIVFFGPETPALYGPVGEHAHIFYRGLPCSPCLSSYNSKYSTCRNNLCLKTILPSQVLEVIDAEIDPARA